MELLDESLDPLEGFPDVVAALAAAVPPVAPPARLKERLDARIREFVREREASFNLLARPPDCLRDRLLTAPGERRRRPRARLVVTRCGREAAFFCWSLTPREGFTLVFERADGTVLPCVRLDTDGSGEGEIPYLALPSGPRLKSVALRHASSGEAILSARL